MGAACPGGVPAKTAEAFGESSSRARDEEVCGASLPRGGFPPQRSRGQVEIDQFVAADRARWAAVIKALNISLD